jgi:hypothetical protein
LGLGSDDDDNDDSSLDRKRSSRVEMPNSDGWDENNDDDDDDDDDDEKDEIIEKQKEEKERLKRLIEEKDATLEEARKVSPKKVVANKRSCHNRKVWTRQEMVWIQHLGSVVRNDIGRKIKFLPAGYMKWSLDDKTVCGRVMSHYTHIPEGDRRKVWDDVLRHHLWKKHGEYKNKVTQCMRDQHKGERFRHANNND